MINTVVTDNEAGGAAAAGCIFLLLHSIQCMRPWPEIQTDQTEMAQAFMLQLILAFYSTADLRNTILSENSVGIKVTDGNTVLGGQRIVACYAGKNCGLWFGRCVCGQ